MPPRGCRPRGQLPRTQRRGCAAASAPDPQRRGAHWLSKFGGWRRQALPLRPAPAPAPGGAAVAVAELECPAPAQAPTLPAETKGRPFNIADPDSPEAQRVFAEANRLRRSRRYGLDDRDLAARHEEGMALRIRVEERELLRQFEAERIVAAQRAQWGLHPIHFVKRWDTRCDQWGEDIVPYSLEKLESMRAEWLLQDHNHRTELELRFHHLGWPLEALWALMRTWYTLLPEPRRFFAHGPYYQSMRPRSRGPGRWPRRQLQRADKRLHAMREREGPAVVFEERHSHKVIRDAMACGALPFVQLPPPALIWETLPHDVIIDDNILGRADLVLERRQGAVLLRRWLPNGQKISCEVLGAHYLTQIAEPTPQHVDWDEVEKRGGFLLHQNMNNAVDHPNNFRVVGRVEEAAALLCQFSPDPTVEFTPRDYRFWPYLWVLDPGHFGIEPAELRSPRVEAVWRRQCAANGSEPAVAASADPLQAAAMQAAAG
eukprot:TRINITY_DN56433_c0_g1_i1.p1 TRINITY_DN56433_c0_g1~~TRINITY_DN56433_c0_g1_i1.p1  ORF type:complete len:488 (+),score=99.39 TRINITY_DN56433_c0_g1_i1:75-1538(+)